MREEIRKQFVERFVQSDMTLLMINFVHRKIQVKSDTKLFVVGIRRRKAISLSIGESTVVRHAMLYPVKPKNRKYNYRQKDTARSGKDRQARQVYRTTAKKLSIRNSPMQPSAIPLNNSA